MNDRTLEPPVNATLIWNTNPALIQPDATKVHRGLLRDDLFTVVVEHFLTDTARFADVVLPSTTQLEHFDVLGAWGHHWITVNEAAVEPLGASRSHGWIMRALAARLGLTNPALAESDEEIGASALPAGITLDDLRTSHWVKSSPTQLEPPDVLAVSLCQPEPALPSPREGALQLLTPKAQHFMNSSFANMPRQQAAMGRPVLQMHPVDAAARALGDGDRVLIQADDRQIEASLEIDPGIIPGVVALPGKWWRASGAAANTLTPSSWSPGGQPAYNDTYVAVHAAQNELSG